jgi:hypothetical protein
MKTWLSGDTAPPFLASALDVGEWSASRPGCFTLREGALGIHCLYACKHSYTFHMHVDGRSS